MKENITELNFNKSYIGLRNDTIKFVDGNGNTILDIGCATGTTGKYLIDNSIADKVYGIENDEYMANQAKEHYTEVIIGDVERMNLEKHYGNISFDYIILGDILEHLLDPWILLSTLRNLLSPNGKIIISIPNFQHIDVLIHVFIKGYYPYNQRGIFDKTHIRFFTLKNILELADKSSLEITKIHRKFRYRDKLNSSFPFYGCVLKRLFKNYYTFQYLVICQKK